MTSNERSSSSAAIALVLRLVVVLSLAVAALAGFTASPAAAAQHERKIAAPRSARLSSSAAFNPSPQHAYRAAQSKSTEVLVLLIALLPAQGHRELLCAAEYASGLSDAGGDPVNASDPTGDVIALGAGVTTPWLDWQLGGCLSNQVSVDSCASPAPSAIYTLVTNCTSSLTVSAECAANGFAALGNIVWSATLPGALTGSQIPHFCGPAGISYGAAIEGWQVAAMIAGGGGASADEATLAAETFGRGAQETSTALSEYEIGGTLEHILSDATAGKFSKSFQFLKSGGFDQANADFDALTNGADVVDRGDGLRTATLSNGTEVNVRPFSSGKWPTLEIDTPGGPAIKIRY
jgi:hypothetical protein